MKNLALFSHDALILMQIKIQRMKNVLWKTETENRTTSKDKQTYMQLLWLTRASCVHGISA